MFHVKLQYTLDNTKCIIYHLNSQHCQKLKILIFKDVLIGKGCIIIWSMDDSSIFLVEGNGSQNQPASIRICRLRDLLKEIKTCFTGNAYGKVKFWHDKKYDLAMLFLDKNVAQLHITHKLLLPIRFYLHHLWHKCL